MPKLGSIVTLYPPSAPESVASVASLKRSRGREERQGWRRDESGRWMPRGTVTEPIDDELLFEELRAQENDSRPERPLSKRKVGAPTIAWVRGAVESQAGAYCEYVESTLAAQRFMRCADAGSSSSFVQGR